ncbi:MAG: hypothetical protein E7A72_01125 [Actinomyces urogenitalis]|uniref:Uridine kinase n=2 Tax=Actinomyces urogenitalis TaxID=103621 RepID=A0A2I1KVA4_9ACTO|nr:hypothetical protein [Actinomyces urogenitalis]MDU0971481.1 hypothetical protein [Actinomyces urogenitalis]MDU6150901.1 hypothetical protein [Actinomyces urogenitalis]PKY99554.1 hypothetical protein CYJ26_01280 [Actinomyces urogenitalis]
MSAPALPRDLATLLPDLRSRDGLGPAEGPRVVLVVDGMTGSGKSTLAASLTTELTRRGWRTGVLAVEDLVPGWDGLAQGVDLAAQALRELAASGRARARSWDWEAMAPGPVREVVLPAASALVLEGCGALAAAAQDLPGLTVIRVLLQAPAHLRHARVAARDPYSWDVAAWEAQERQVARVWQADRLRWGPAVVLTGPTGSAARRE